MLYQNNNDIVNRMPNYTTNIAWYLIDLTLPNYPQQHSFSEVWSFQQVIDLTVTKDQCLSMSHIEKQTITKSITDKSDRVVSLTIKAFANNLFSKTGTSSKIKCNYLYYLCY